MREQPWHIRRITHEHERWFANLRDIQALSRAWLEFAKLAPSRPLETALARDLKALMDDTSPEDVLGRLEAEVWTEQARAWTEAQKARAGGTATREQLETATALLLERSLDAGEAAGQRDWGALFAAKPATLEQAFAALAGTPLGGRPGAAGFLICRSVERELEADCLRCPHVSPSAAVRERADALCAAHLGWLKGYVRALNRGLHFESRVQRKGDGRCGLRLTYLN